MADGAGLLVVANAGSDTLSVIDTRTDKILETICARQNPGDPFGAQPDALTFDKRGKKLFAGNGTQNAVAVFQFKPGTSKLLGLIPVGWFPGALAFDAGRKKICVANIKKSGGKMKNPAGLGHVPGFNSKQYNGSLSLVPCHQKKNWRGSRRRRWPICATRCSRRQCCPRAKIACRSRCRNVLVSHVSFSMSFTSSRKTALTIRCSAT